MFMPCNITQAIDIARLDFFVQALCGNSQQETMFFHFLPIMALLSLSQGWNCKAITTENSISSQAVKNGINKRNNIYIYTYIYIPPMLLTTYITRSLQPN